MCLQFLETNFYIKNRTRKPIVSLTNLPEDVGLDRTADKSLRGFRVVEESDLKGRTALRTEITDLLQLACRPFVKVDTGPIPLRVRDIVRLKTTAENMSK